MSSSPDVPIPNVSISTNGKEPVFQAPWEAHAFAIVHQLAIDDRYSWAEWTEQLSAIIAQTEHEAPGEKAYYELWVEACETMLVSKGLLNTEDVEQKINDILAAQENEHQH